MKPIVTFFDKLEDRIRISLSHRPILYALIGGVGIVLFWKGVWESAEYFPVLYGPASALLGVVILLMTGLMVSFFIGDSIILSGYKHEKKLVEKTEEVVREEQENLDTIMKKLDRIEKGITSLTESR